MNISAWISGLVCLVLCASAGLSSLNACLELSASFLMVHLERWLTEHDVSISLARSQHPG